MCVACAVWLAAPNMGFGAVQFQLNGLVADAVITGPRTGQPQNGTAGIAVTNPGGFTLKVGAVSTATDGGRVPVFVFQLPNWGSLNNPFLTASFTFNVGVIDSNTNTNNLDADLYGLGRRASNQVLVTDYYLGNAADTTDAVRLQTSILDDDTTPANSVVTTSAGGSTALLNYLNAQYAGGAGIGQFVFLRLSPDANMTGTTGYNVYTADAASSTDPTVADNFPFITYTAVPEPTAWLAWSLIGLVVPGFVVCRSWL